jgi:peptidoglycan/xylan/chitin deacetylase (PgdA/CDA1 family)
MGGRTTRTRCWGLLVSLASATAVSTMFPGAADAMTAVGHRPNAVQIRLATPDRRAVPILMYHVIREPYRDAPYPALYVPRAEFAAQMRWLDRHHYEAVTLQHVYDAWHGRAVLPARPVVLSFDDGANSHYTNALPVLRELGWPGVLNLDLSNLEPSWGIRPWMVRELIAAGWEVDAHSLTHPDLTSLSGSALRREVAGSRAEIRRRFGVAAEFFCFPSGRYDARVVEAVRAAGFLGATTTEPGLGRAAEPFTLSRVRVDGGDGAGGLARKLKALEPR